MQTPDHTTAGFPRGLLSRPKRERRAHFEQYTVLHTRLKEVCAELLSVILDPADTSLVFLAGPTGVGKTKLIRYLEVKLAEHLLPDLEEDRGRLPFVTVEVPAPETSVFSWRDLYKRTLLAMEEPLVGHKTAVPARPGPAATEPAPATLSDRSRVTQEVRRALESVLRHRRPLVSILDEGHHLMKIASGRKLHDQLDIIKSLANMSGVPHLLAGTYDLLPFLDLSGQLSRRSTVIELPRYHAGVAEDVRLFASVVRAFQRNLPLAEEPDLLGQVEYLYQRSIGCVGVLKNWLARALNVALEADATTLTLAHLEKRALKPAQCRRMLADARAGEEKLADDKAELALLREELRLDAGTAGNTAPTRPESKRGQGRRPRPFQRRPGRDPVGGKDDDAP